MITVIIPLTRPDIIEKQWVSSEGFLCCVVQPTKHGHRCGYVRLPPNHKYINKKQSEIENAAYVHGGITYCEIDKKGFLWVGFDCFHCCDLPVNPDAPEDELTKKLKYMKEAWRGIKDGGHYWTLEEVVEETNRLSEQLAEE